MPLVLPVRGDSSPALGQLATGAGLRLMAALRASSQILDWRLWRSTPARVQIDMHAEDLGNTRAPRR
ncbi:hypothetical protein KC342_g30 [Hortaea werneckii]|nr:hypothetical protein KC342_g30 [Hortaea werneckii]